MDTQVDRAHVSVCRLMTRTGTCGRVARHIANEGFCKTHHEAYREWVDEHPLSNANEFAAYARRYFA